MNKRQWHDFVLVAVTLFVIAAWAILSAGNTAYVSCIAKGGHTILQCVELTK
jgi:hypothetical protein